MKCTNIEHFYLVQGSGSNDARSPTKSTICLFPDCNSLIVFFDLHDNDLKQNEKAEACFAYKTNSFSMISRRHMFRNAWKPFYLVPQDVPKGTQSRIHDSQIRYNYKCFGARSQFEAANAFINLHDHVFITLENQIVVLHIKPIVFLTFHKTRCLET